MTNNALVPDKHIGEMTKEDFEKVPYYKDIDFDTEMRFNSIVIIPTGEFHESGYQMMDYVVVSDEYKAVCRLSGISDILELDGIGGYGPASIRGCVRLGKRCVIDVKGWQIDCLPCGYLRLFARSKLYLGRLFAVTSSVFEIFAE